MSSASSYDESPRWHLWLIVVAVAIELPLGAYGYYQYEILHGREGSWLSSLYQSVQLLVLHAPHLEQPVHPALQSARWIAALTFGWAATAALYRVLGLHLRRLLLRFRKGHVVICGAGWRGVPLAEDYARPQPSPSGELQRQPAKVVVIESDPGCPGLRKCEELGIPYVIGNAADPDVLKSVGAHKAGKLVVACTDDATNLEIAVRARQLVSDRGRRDPYECYVHLANPDLRTIARRKQLIAADGSRFRATTVGIDIYENAARWLFAHYPLDRPTTTPITASNSVRVHLVIVGFGQMGESILIQAARIGHYANELPLRVTVIAADVATSEKAFRGRYPQIDKVCDVKFEATGAEDPAVVAMARQFCEEPDSLVTIAICLPDGACALSLAMKLGDELKECRTPVRVRVPTRAGLGLLLSEKRQRELFGDQIRPFGMIEDACNVDLLERRDLDVVGLAIHKVYVDEQIRKGETLATNPALVSWDELPEDWKNSSRYAADHLETKLHAVGCHSATRPGDAEPVEALPPPMVELLARMEHARFCAERFLAGWRLAPGRKDPVRKTNPTLVPWDQLPEDEREKDREQVRRIPQILRAAGKYMCR